MYSQHENTVNTLKRMTAHQHSTIWLHNTASYYSTPLHSAQFHRGNVLSNIDILGIDINCTE